MVQRSHAAFDSTTTSARLLCTSASDRVASFRSRNKSVFPMVVCRGPARLIGDGQCHEDAVAALENHAATPLYALDFLEAHRDLWH